MKRFPLRRKASGFSLIEVLIALVVLAVGLLGLALLQTMNLRYTKSANQRTQAVNLSNELLDMIRSNRTEMGAYNMNLGDMSSARDPGATGCLTDAALTAASNIERWKCEVREALGDDAQVTVVATPANSTVNITVSWIESNMPALTNQGKIEMSTQI